MVDGELLLNWIKRLLKDLLFPIVKSFANKFVLGY